MTCAWKKIAVTDFKINMIGLRTAFTYQQRGEILVQFFLLFQFLPLDISIVMQYRNVIWKISDSFARRNLKSCTPLRSGKYPSN